MPKRRLMLLLLALPLYMACSATYLNYSGQAGAARDWRNASREPAGLAPDPAVVREPVVQVYSARAVRWRSYFAVHTWIAVKPQDAERFTIYEVMGYQLRRTGTSVRSRERAPDAYWYGNRPELLSDVRGPGVDALITRVEAAVKSYPYADTYRAWPGPNSNTFIAWVTREVRSCAWTCRPLPSARTISASCPSHACPAARAASSMCSALPVSPWAWKRAWS